MSSIHFGRKAYLSEQLGFLWSVPEGSYTKLNKQMLTEPLQKVIIVV